MNLRELLERRAAIATEMRGIIDKSGANGELPADNVQKFDTLKGELEALEPRIARQSLVEETERRMAGQPLHNPAQPDRADAFGRMVSEFRIGAVMGGLAGLSGVDYGREREVSQEIARRSGRNPNGIFVPLEALTERRAMQANALTSGGALTATTVVQDVIEPLRAKTVVGRLGATMLSDLTGVIEIPSISKGVPTRWIGEGQTITQGDPKLGMIRMSPRTVAGLCEFSHAMLKNTSLSVENLLRNDLARGIALAIDVAALTGSGIGPEPLGVFNMPGIRSRAFNASVNLANISTDLAAMVGAVLDANVDENTLGWVMHPRAGLWLSTVRATDGGTVWPSITTMGLDGRPVATTTSMPLTNTDTKANGLFGNWRDMIVGTWGALDVTANPYGEAYKRGGVEVRAIMDADINVRYLQSFVKATNMPITEAVA